MSRRDPRAFLTWDVVRETLCVPPFARFIALELQFLRWHDWNRWASAIKERFAGFPSPCLFYPLSSSTAIHHAYHISRFETIVGVEIQSFELILEFGAGYGSLCRIAHNLGFRGSFISFDLPEQCALQRYYLSSVGVGSIVSISDPTLISGTLAAAPSRGPRLFIATWSLSESPSDLRRQIAEAIADFDAFLIAYMDRFLDIDNASFFSEWRTWFPEIRWITLPIEHLPGSTYLFGIKSTLESRRSPHTLA